MVLHTQVHSSVFSSAWAFTWALLLEIGDELSTPELSRDVYDCLQFSPVFSPQISSRDIYPVGTMIRVQGYVLFE